MRRCNFKSECCQFPVGSRGREMSDRRTEKQVLKPDLVAEIAIPTSCHKYSNDRASEGRDRPTIDRYLMIVGCEAYLMFQYKC